MQVVAVIPARYASTRFPGKPLVSILGKPMIQWVYERTAQARLVDRVIVATDDSRIAATVETFGGEYCMTSADHATGTDRLAEVAGRLNAALIVNVQGDEPLIDPLMIDQAIQPLLDDAAIRMGTLAAAIRDDTEFLNPNVVKVVTNCQGFALYFSRSPIPHERDRVEQPDSGKGRVAWKHIGLYVYRRDFLLEFAGWPETQLEQLEKLEQLRALEHGVPIRVVVTEGSSIGVDTPADLARIEAQLKSTS
ncbi:MAG TPA: 3-deoxy-manno-octulosonate cytidylyltransferase [Geothermobacteraceae bacterium]|nr:3-deoxy-manno-octulosonate cytidylyltransferase [Geothermobacteraceae bacterium]